LAADGIIPIGLYRGVFPHMNIGPKQNKACYVYTNPAKDTELFSCDKVYVLSPKPLIKSSKKGIKMAEEAMNRRVASVITSNFDLQQQVGRIEERLLQKVKNIGNSLQNYIGSVSTLPNAPRPI